MPSVNRIFRLRSTVRSDEMKAESTLPPAQPVSVRGMPTRLVKPALNFPVWSCVTRQALTGQQVSSARQTVYETNSGGGAPPQTGRAAHSTSQGTRRTVSIALYLGSVSSRWRIQ